MIISLIPNIKQQQKQKQISNRDIDNKNSNRSKNNTNSDKINKKLQQKVLFFKRGWQRQVILAIMENLVLDGPELHWYYFSDSQWLPWHWCWACFLFMEEHNRLKIFIFIITSLIEFGNACNAKANRADQKLNLSLKAVSSFAQICRCLVWNACSQPVNVTFLFSSSSTC